MAAALLRAALLFSLGVAAAIAPAQETPDPLEAGFKSPPDTAKPRTWWHWISGNVTKEGITKDLEWMQRVGIGGFQLADVSFGGGQTIDAPLAFGSPEWLDAVRHAAAEADRLGLEMGIFSSPGWSVTGGPWVKPEQAMKKLVWSECVVEGPATFDGVLEHPPIVNGAFGNQGRGGRRGDNPPDPTHYGDSAVLAYRTPAEETSLADHNPGVTASGGEFDAAVLFDDDLNSSARIAPPAGGGPAWIEYRFAEPFTARAFTIGGPGGIPAGRILAGDDPADLRTIVTLPGAQLYRQGRLRTFAFPAATARLFRVEMTGAPLNPAQTMSQAETEAADRYVLFEAKPISGARVQRWEEKAVFSFLFEYDSVPTPAIAADAVIDPAEVVDLTSKMAADGRLQWDVPPGRWTILRMGYSLTGAKNRPPQPSGSGYEADKFSREHMEAYLHGYFDPIAGALGPLFGKSLRFVVIDSWEAGYHNWTETMTDEFRARRGYDPTPWLPVLTGRVVGNADAADRFLWDFRRTLADMWADHHYGATAEWLAERGIGAYAEAAGVSLEIPEDTLLNKSKVTVPMAEFWVRDLHPRLMYYQDVRGAASAAHVYGKPIVAAEAFTGGGHESPLTLKKVADYWMAQGINQLVFHTSTHQPLDTKPGNAMVGAHLHRNITWAEQAAPFMTYLSRTSYLLQQGRPVADLAYLLNEGAPSTMPIWGAGLTPAPPEGYDYDYVNADVLLQRMSVADDGRLVLPDGMSYRVLALPEIDSMRPELLRKLRELVDGGATIVGPRPVRSPSLAGYPACDGEVLALAAELWGDLDGVSRTVRRCGKGRVVWGAPLEEVLGLLEVAPDAEFADGLDTEVAWIHRRTAEADIYYVANLSDRSRELKARFRVTGKAPELWHPDTGEIEAAGYSLGENRTVVPLRMDAHELAFVVFRQPAREPTRTIAAPLEAVIASIEGPWRIDFPPDLGAPASIQLPEPISWTETEDDGVKYFSGTASYSITFAAPARDAAENSKTVLDLGAVADIAEVSVNGRALGILWKPPYRIDVTGVLTPGENELRIDVTNQWGNRILGDRSLADDEKILTSSSRGPGGRFGGRGGPAPSGLLGPVRLMAVIQP
jgi:hypothetical protein